MARTAMLSEQQKGIEPPYVPGREAAGVVDEVGEGVTTGVKVGDLFLGMVIPRGDHGANREQIVLNAQSVVPVPCRKVICRSLHAPQEWADGANVARSSEAVARPNHCRRTRGRLVIEFA
jgi:hypothetical protein